MAAANCNKDAPLPCRHMAAGRRPGVGQANHRLHLAVVGLRPQHWGRLIPLMQVGTLQLQPIVNPREPGPRKHAAYIVAGGGRKRRHIDDGADQEPTLPSVQGQQVLPSVCHSVLHMLNMQLQGQGER